MSKVIEILDSDEDIDEPSEDTQVHSLTEASKSVANVEANAGETAHAATQPAATTKEVNNSSNTTGATIAPQTQNPDSQTKPRSRHRRKSNHQHMRASPEMQFETISLDDEDEEANPGTSNSQKTKPIAKAAKLFKTTPKILGTKPPTTDELVETEFDEFLANDEVSAMIKQIAEERVRVNFLLASYGMPDISFSLYTNYERLKFQFEDRVKQRKMRSWNRSQEAKTKKSKTQEGS